MIDKTSISSNPGNNRQRTDLTQLSVGQNGKPSDTGKTDTPTAKVELSSQAHTLAKLEKSIGLSTGVDTEKVSQFKAAIASGEYTVNSDSLADRLLNH